MTLRKLVRKGNYMNILLQSKGKAKMTPNFVNTRIMISVKGKDREKVSKTLIDAIGNYSERIKERVKDVTFDSYSITEQKKRVKKTKHGEEEIKDVFDYFLGTAYLNAYFKLSAETIEKLDKIAVKISKALSKDSVKVFITNNHIYTLSEESFEDLNAMAVNNALDKMGKQANEIASHLGFSRCSLKKIDFVDDAPSIRNNQVMYKAATSSSSTIYQEYSLKELDNILAFKPVEKEVDVVSEWVMIGI